MKLPFVSQNDFEHVEFVLPMDKKSWYSNDPSKKNWQHAEGGIQAHPRSKEHDEIISQLFGESEYNKYIAQLKKSQNDHWTFLLHDKQEMQLVFNQAKELVGARFRHDHLGSEAAELLLNALQKQGHDIFAADFLKNNLDITGSKEFVKNSNETLNAHIAARQKLSDTKPAEETKNVIEATKSPQPVNTPAHVAAAALAGVAALGVSAPAGATTTPPSSSTPSVASAWGIKATHTPQIVVDQMFRPEIQGDLLETVSRWAEHYQQLKENSILDRSFVGKAKTGVYESANAHLKQLSGILTVLSGAKDESTGKYPGLSESSLKSMRQTIGPAGQDPSASNAKQPDWNWMVKHLGLGVNSPTPTTLRTPGSTNPPVITYGTMVQAKPNAGAPKMNA